MTALVAVLAATLLSFGVARTITRPLATITDVMRQVSTTGDLTRKIPVRGSRWADEDARLLATTFNTLTDSIARFQREVSQKERLSALGRLSTVIAHEIRNPLMIIKTALHALRQPDLERARLGEAVTDIDDEVARLNRVVNEVLDFARPIRFEQSVADINLVCRESAAAAQAAPGPAVYLDLAASLPPVTTDAERLRVALVNLMVNARHAAEANAPAASAGLLRGHDAGVVVSTLATDSRVAIIVADRGAGIAAADLPRVFDPYFTTKRGGTGLGLPIARNIVEGLGGVISITSQPGPGHRDSHRAAPGSASDMTRRGSILLVDDEEKILKALGRALRDAGHEVIETTSAREGQRLLADRQFDLFIVDNVMPQLGGLDMIREYVAASTDGDRAQILMMTAHATVESALEAMKLGALDYLQKPFEIDELLVVVQHALEHQRLRTEYRYLRSERDEQFDHYGIIGRSKVMEEIIRRAERVADTKSTVLITGETGTGKELVARAIHNRSAQRDMPLIKVNCAAIPESLLESELFGHVKGAFTGALTTKKGKFALADGGTIFLDEIGTMTPTLQSKLLRVLQEREFEPLGSERSERVDLRVIAATNRDLRQMVADGKFQEDLFYRLNVIPIALPPLRDRRDDIPALVDHFIRKHAQRTGRRIERIEDTALDTLKQYDWPGNVRELENAIERAVVLSTGPAITANSVSVLGAVSSQMSGLPSLKLRPNIEWVERETIRRAIETARGVKKEAAELMGISQRALSYYLAKYRID